MRFSFGKVLLLILLLLLAGCLNPEQESQLRFDCVDLSSGSFALVPDCGSQEECYQKAENELFPFDDSQLDFDSRRVLESYKNSLALSWRYFNESQIELKKIRDQCWNKEQWNELPLRVNRLNHLLAQAFVAADQANQQAIIFLASEKEWLAEQELDLVREESLFDDWVLLQNNLNELQTKQPQGKSLASKMLQAQERIDAVFAQYGFGKRFVAAEQLADLLPENRRGILESLPKKTPFLPAFAGIVIDFASQFANQQRLQESVQTLKRFPTFAFFSAYQELVGTQDSIAHETAALAGRLAEHHQQAEEKMDQLQQELEEKMGMNAEKARGFRMETANGLPAETFQALVIALKPQTRISLKNFEIMDWGETQPKLEQRLLEIRTEFSKTVERRVLGLDSIGSRLKSLKEIQNRLLEWEANLLFLETEFQGGLMELCADRMRQIARESKTEYSEATALELAAQARFFVEQFGEEKQPSKKLDYCGRAIQSFESLSLFLKDQKKFEAETKQATGNCFSFLETAFKNPFEELAELEWQWNQLQEKRKDSRTPIPELAIECENLSVKTKNKLLESQTITELLENAAAINQYWGGLLALQPESEKLERAQKQVFELRAFFANQQILFEKALPVLPELLPQSQKLREELHGLFGEELKDFLERNSQTISFSEQTPKANQSNWLYSQIAFSNPTGIEWKEPLEIEMPGKWGNAFAEEASPNVSAVFVREERLRILFASVPLGISSAKIKSEQFVSTSEKNDFLFANQFKALVQKTIGFETESAFLELLVSTDVLVPEAANVWVIFKNAEKPFSRNGESIEFKIEKVSSQSTATIFFTVPNPLHITENFSSERNKLEWGIGIQNQLAETIPKPQIVLFLPEESVKELEAADESGKKLAVLQFEKEARIELPELLPKENKTITVNAQIDNQQELLEKIAFENHARLEALTNHSNASIQESAKRLLAELLGKKGSLEEIFRIASQTRELEEKANRYRLDTEQFLETVSSAEKKTAELELVVQSLKQQGFFGIAGELAQRIQKSRELLQQAKNSNETGDLSLAATLGMRALAALEEGKSKNRDSFEQKRKEILAEAAELEAIISEFLSENPEALRQQQPIQEALVLLEQSAWENNPASFLKQLNQAKTALETGRKNLDELLKARAETVHEQVERFQQLVSGKGLESKNKDLLNWLDKYPESELVGLGIALPFRKNDLEKRRQKIVGLASQKQETLAQEFESLYQKQEFGRALRAFEKSPASKPSFSQAASLEKEIEADWQAVKEMAGIALEKAQSLAAQERLDSKQASLLLKAQKAFEQQEFLEALVLAKKITGSTASNPTGLAGMLNRVPVVIVPVLVGIVALVFFRWRKKETKEKEVQKIKVERVPNEL